MRKIALDGLVRLSKPGVIEDPGMIQGCYCRAVELLCDMEDCVRSAAVRAVRYLSLKCIFLFFVIVIVSKI